jgi:protein SDA1
MWKLTDLHGDVGGGSCAQGVNSSKKKKQAKLKRVIASAKRHAREENEGKQQATFAALQLLNDPQVLRLRL